MSRKNLSRRRRLGTTKLRLELLEARLVLSGNPPDPFMPGDTPGVTKMSQVVFDGAPADEQITITNNTLQTVYPILRDANSNVDLKPKDLANKGKGLYDPIDNPNEEYRGYIGYHDGSTYYLGLPKGATITFTVPLVFWDAGRLDIATDATYLIPPNPEDINKPNPFFYYTKNQDDGSDTLRFRANTTDGTNGAVMWYHWRGKGTPDPVTGLIIKSIDMGPDAPFQLSEFTIRNQFLGTLATAADIADSEKQPAGLINYDVSYVDSIVLPMAMEADPVPIVPIPPPKEYTGPIPPGQPFGWIGAQQSFQDMQSAIKDFTGNTSANGLGNYFGGMGYPAYYIPDTTGLAGVKLPAGQNIYLQSPMNGPPNGLGPTSHYDSNRFLLTSAGTQPIQAIIGGGTDGTAVLQFTNAIEIAKLKDVVAGMTVTTNDGGIADGTTVLSVNPNAGTNLATVTLSKSATDSKLHTFTFKRLINDYVTDKLTNLWYAWANYYADKHQVASVVVDDGTIEPNKRVLTFNKVVTGLAVGMPVTGPGLPASLMASITKITTTSNQTTIEINKLSSGGLHGKYTFAAPPQFTLNGQEPPKLTFSPSSPDLAKAEAFAVTAYKVMAAMSTIPEVINASPALKSLVLMADVIGGNIGKIENIGVYNPLKPNDPTNDAIPNEVRDGVKSLLRGVPDFNDPQYPEATTWYPDPKQATQGASIGGTAVDFNVFNMNPFVFFVHKTLKLSGYGFSLDDDVADVGANGAKHLNISIGGLHGLKQTIEWAAGAPFGPISIDGTIIPNDDKKLTKIHNLPYLKVLQVFGLTPLGPGALVLGPTPGVIPEGTRVFQTGLNPTAGADNWVILDHEATSSITGTFKFVGRVEAGALAFGTPTLSADEGSTIEIPVMRTGGSDGSVSAAYSVSSPSGVPFEDVATPGQDFQGPLSGTVTFNDGETQKIISFALPADHLVEETEYFAVSVQSPTGGASLGAQNTITVGIQDEDLPFVLDSTPRLATLQAAGLSIGKSTEYYQQFVANTYGHLLGRPADVAGLIHWVTLMQLYETSNHTQGLRQAQIEAGFLASPEYLNRNGGGNETWLRGVYYDLLGRDIDASGLQFWQAELSAGMSANAVALGISSGDERLAERASDTYLALLGRAPDPSDLVHWVANLRSGGTTEDISSGLVGSLEYYNKPAGAAGNAARWVREAYRDILSRSAATDEVIAWLYFLSH